MSGVTGVGLNDCRAGDRQCNGGKNHLHFRSPKFEFDINLWSHTRWRRFSLGPNCDQQLVANRLASLSLEPRVHRRSLVSGACYAGDGATRLGKRLIRVERDHSPGPVALDRLRLRQRCTPCGCCTAAKAGDEKSSAKMSRDNTDPPGFWPVGPLVVQAAPVPRVRTRIARISRSLRLSSAALTVASPRRRRSGGCDSATSEVCTSLSSCPRYRTAAAKPSDETSSLSVELNATVIASIPCLLVPSRLHMRRLNTMQGQECRRVEATGVSGCGPVSSTDRRRMRSNKAYEIGFELTGVNRQPQGSVRSWRKP